MVQLAELVSYTDTLLRISEFKDYSPNGLQVEGRSQVGTLVSGVTASLALVNRALELAADALLVHHGYFWKGEDGRVTGYKKQRMQRLLNADVSLLAYHLPLDAHPVYGNNAQLARLLNLEIKGSFDTASARALGLHGNLHTPMSGTRFAAHIEACLGRAPLYVPGADREIRTVAWCTGAAQAYIEHAVELGVDAYVTGEVSEQTVHIARETGVHFFAAGHHATERYGVQALGQHVAHHFAIKHFFVDLENPV